MRFAFPYLCINTVSCTQISNLAQFRFILTGASKHFGEVIHINLCNFKIDVFHVHTKNVSRAFYYFRAIVFEVFPEANEAFFI